MIDFMNFRDFNHLALLIVSKQFGRIESDKLQILKDVASVREISTKPIALKALSRLKWHLWAVDRDRRLIGISKCFYSNWINIFDYTHVWQAHYRTVLLLLFVVAKHCFDD